MFVDSGSVLDLLRLVEEQKIWGSLQFTFQEGRLIHTELRQTLKPQPVGAEEAEPELIILKKIG